MNNPFENLRQKAKPLGKISFTEYLVARTDAQTGELGWMFKKIPVNDDLFMSSVDPVLLAHDLLEHVNGLEAIGSIDDEFQALGGTYYVRGFMGELRRDGAGSAHTFEQNIASDIIRMFRELTIADFTFFDERQLEGLECEIDDEIDEVLQHARESIQDEFNDEEEFLEFLEESPFDSVEEYLRQAKLYMTMGFLKAEARYGHDRWAANNLFWNMHDAIRGEPDYEGQEFVLTIDGESASFEEYYPEEEYDDDFDNDDDEDFEAVGGMEP